MRKRTLIRAVTVTREIKGKTKVREIIPGNFNKSDTEAVRLYNKQLKHRKVLRKIRKESRKRNRKG